MSDAISSRRVKNSQKKRKLNDLRLKLSALTNSDLRLGTEKFSTLKNSFYGQVFGGVIS